MSVRRHLPHLYVQVLIGIAAGALLGYLAPEYGAAMKPLGDGFIKLVRMLIAPIVFTTVVVGIAQTGAMKEVGRIGARALLYFEVVSTVALLIGLIVARTLQPGAGMNFNPATADVSAVASYTTASKNLHTVDFILNIIPDALIGAFTGGEILQVLLVSVLFGLALLRLGEPLKPLVDFFALASKVLFEIVAIIMRLAPIGAFGAMAFTVGRYGIASLDLARQADGRRLHHLRPVRLRRPGHDRDDGRLQPVQVPSLHRRGNPDRPRHVIVGVGAAPADDQDGAAGLRAVGRRSRRAHRLLVQPRWHLHLHDDGGAVRGAGERRAPDAGPGTRDAGDPDADVEGRCRRHRRRIHHAGGDAFGVSRRFPSPA